MSLVRYEPWSLFDRFQDELNRLTRNEYFGRDANDSDNSNVVTSHWRPAVDIKEEKDRFFILADIPGVDPKDIEITIKIFLSLPYTPSPVRRYILEKVH